MADTEPFDTEDHPPYRLTTESRFIVQPVELKEFTDIHQQPEGATEDAHSLVDGVEFRHRLNSNTSQLTQSDLSRLGILSSMGDAGMPTSSMVTIFIRDLMKMLPVTGVLQIEDPYKFYEDEVPYLSGSLLGSSLLLSTPSYLNVSNEIGKTEIAKPGETATSMEYLDTIMENADYIDTVKGRLPLAEAARMISQDRSKHSELFNAGHVRKVRRDSYKRLFCMGFSFLCLFASFYSLRNLQSSTSTNATLGFVTFGCLNSLNWFGCLASNTVIYYVRPKWSLAVASMPFLLYPLASFYPSEYTLIPCALMCGIGAGLLWSSEGIYMINLAATYAMVSRKPLLEVIGKFNAVFFPMQQSSHIIGNLLSSTLLSENLNMFSSTPTDIGSSSAHDTNLTANVSAITAGNVSWVSSNSTLSCGMSYTAGEDRTGTGRRSAVDTRQLMVLYGVLMLLALIGAVNFIFILSPLKTPKIAGNNSLIKNLRKFFCLFGSPQIWLLVPFMAYPGYSSSVVLADYTKAYITCSYGVEYIGYILLTAACFSVLGAFVSGRLVHLTGRIPLFLFAATVSTSSVLIMIFWKPASSQIGLTAFVPVCLWCLADSVIISQLNGFLGEIFRSDLACALSMLNLWHGIGVMFGTLATAFNFLSLTNKQYVCIVHAWVSCALLITLEWLRRIKKAT